MAETFYQQTGSKQEQYQSLLPQIQALISDERDCVANMANVCAVLKQQFDWLWIGFYVVKGEELVLAPFQGPIACTRIGKGRGVCGSAWSQQQTIIVPDVNQFAGHIACSSLSQSEIVVPCCGKSVVWVCSTLTARNWRLLTTPMPSFCSKWWPCCWRNPICQFEGLCLRFQGFAHA